MTAILLALGSSVGYGVSDFLASRVARGERPGPLALAGLVMVLGGIAVTSLASEEPDEAAPAPTWHDPSAGRPPAPAPARPGPARPGRGRAVRAVRRRRRPGRRGPRGGVLWVALGVQLGALPTTLVGALATRGRRLGIDDPALLAPVALLTVLNLSADAFLAHAVTRGDLAVVSVLASLAPVVTALLAHALTAERPSAPQLAGAALAVLGTLIVSSAQAAA